MELFLLQNTLRKLTKPLSKKISKKETFFPFLNKALVPVAEA